MATAGSTFVLLAQSLRLRETESVFCRIALWDGLRDEFWPSFSCNFLIPNKRRDYVLKTAPWNPVVQFDPTPSQSLTFSRLYATCTSPIMHLICPPKFCITFVFGTLNFYGVIGAQILRAPRSCEEEIPSKSSKSIIIKVSFLKKGMPFPNYYSRKLGLTCYCRQFSHIFSIQVIIFIHCSLSESRISVSARHHSSRRSSRCHRLMQRWKYRKLRLRSFAQRCHE